MSTPVYLRVVESDVTAIEADGVLIDLIAVERVANGGSAVLTIAEQVCAIVLLRGRGMSAEAIAARLGVHERTVVRWGTPGWAPRRGGRPPAPCGTRAARKRYRRNDEECGPCAEVGVNSRPIRGTTEDSARGWAA